jgi:hypothetical protein
MPSGEKGGSSRRGVGSTGAQRGPMPVCHLALGATKVLSGPASEPSEAGPPGPARRRLAPRSGSRAVDPAAASALDSLFSGPDDPHIGLSAVS